MGNNKNSVLISVIALLVIMTPFFVLCFFVHPSLIDDYCFVIKTQEAGLINAFLDWYYHWTGRYSLCFLMSMNPLLWGSFFLYRLVIFSLIALIPLLFYYLLKNAFRQQELSFYIGFTSIFSFLYFFQLPSVYEGVYWMTGAIAYQLPSLCLLLILALFARDFIQKKTKFWNTLAIIGLSVLLIGTNEISMATYMFFLSLLIAYKAATKQPVGKELLWIALVSCIASAVVILSPGNESRTELFVLAHQWPQALKMTFLGFFYYVAQWIGAAALMTIVAFYLLRKAKLSLSGHVFAMPLWVSITSLISILLVGFFIPAWATGQMPNARAINVIFFIFLAGVCYHMIFVYQYLSDRNRLEETGKITAGLVVFAVFFVTFYPGKGINNNIKTAYVDVLSGRAYRYHVYMLKLYQTGSLNSMPEESIPRSIGTAMTEEEYQGCPEQYFKKHYR